MTKQSISKMLATVLITMGVVGLTLSGVLFLRKPHAAQPAGPKGVNASASIFTNETPPPTPQEVKAYSVAADLPKYIDIPAIQVSQARVVPFGLLKSGEIGTPTNTADTGWYKDSAKPGQNGAMFIFGHVSSNTNNGVFHNLKKLKAGDEIFITSGNNETYKYIVKNSASIPADKVDMQAVLSPIDPTVPGLTLMTCDGTFLKQTQSFTNRLIVYASLANGSER